MDFHFKHFVVWGSRGQKETDNAKKFAIEKFAKDILVVADNIDLALKNVKQPGEDADKDLKTLYEGLQMTQKTCTQVPDHRIVLTV